MFLLGHSHGQRSLEGYSPRGCKKSDTTERLTYTDYFESESCLGPPLLFLLTIQKRQPRVLVQDGDTGGASTPLLHGHSKPPATDGTTSSKTSRATLAKQVGEAETQYPQDPQSEGLLQLPTCPRGAKGLNLSF